MNNTTLFIIYLNIFLSLYKLYYRFCKLSLKVFNVGTSIFHSNCILVQQINILGLFFFEKGILFE